MKQFWQDRAGQKALHLCTFVAAVAPEHLRGIGAGDTNGGEIKKTSPPPTPMCISAAFC